MIIESAIAATLTQLVSPGPGSIQTDFTLSASLPADTIEVGREYEIEVSLDLGAGWTTADAGIPTPLLQLDVPESVELSGRVLETYRELSRNEFLSEPFERRFKGKIATVGFTVLSEPGEATLGVNLVAYAKHEDGRVRFVRRRVDLPLQAGAAFSSDVRSEKSDWGRDMGLQIGDKASTFDLPRADGSRVSLDDALGESNIIVTTYRAYW